MKQVLFTKLPDSVIATDIYDNCNIHHDDIHQTALYDKEFEESFKCRLILTHQRWWICEFEDIDYTWFVLKWG